MQREFDGQLARGAVVVTRRVVAHHALVTNLLDELDMVVIGRRDEIGQAFALECYANEIRRQLLDLHHRHVAHPGFVTHALYAIILTHDFHLS